MPRPLEEIVADFDALAARDFDHANSSAQGWERLDEHCDEVCEANKPEMYAQILFRTMERLDKVDLRTPGPLVHTLESWQGNYEALLADSVRRKPSPLSV